MAISERLSNLLLTALGEVESHVELRLLLNTVFSDPVTTKGDLFTYSTVPARFQLRKPS